MSNTACLKKNESGVHHSANTYCRMYEGTYEKKHDRSMTNKPLTQESMLISIMGNTRVLHNNPFIVVLQHANQFKRFPFM